MKRFEIKNIIAITAILLNSCVAYYPQVVDIPLIKGKGDLRINAGIFLAPDFYGNFDTQVFENKEEVKVWPGVFGEHVTVSCGLTDILSIQGYTSVDFASRFHLQGALGAYHAFENKTVIEIYSGCGYGNGYIATRDDYYLPFSQFNIGKTGIGESRIDYGLGLKGGYLFCNFDNWAGQEIVHKKDGWIIEPSVFFRIGAKRVKYCIMANYLWTKTINDGYYFPLSVGMGVNLHFGKVQ